MAEGFFRALGGEEKTGLSADSAGFYTSDGLPASENAVTAAGELGADISAHRSKALTPELAREAKYLVCMTGSQYDNLCAALPDCADKVFTLTPTDVSDPFGGDLEIYRRAAAEIKAGVQSIICGPGDIAQAHTPNEWIELEQLSECERFFEAILDWASAK